MIRREGRAFLGLVVEVAQTLLFRRWDDEPEENAPTIDENKAAPSPVVRVTPAASGMLARAAPMRQPIPTEHEPLEGSIEARRAAREIG